MPHLSSILKRTINSTNYVLPLIPKLYALIDPIAPLGDLHKGPNQSLLSKWSQCLRYHYKITH